MAGNNECLFTTVRKFLEKDNAEELIVMYENVRAKMYFFFF